MSFRVDVTEQNDLATSTQDDAVRNIQGADFFALEPQEFKENSQQLQPEIDKLRKPAQVTPELAAEMKKSPEHTAALGPDAVEFQAAEQVGNIFKNYSTSYMDSIGKTVAAHAGPVRELNDLTSERMANGGKLDEMKDLRYRDLMRQQGDNFGAPDMGSLMGNLPASIAGVATDMVMSVADNKIALGVLSAAGVGLTVVTAPVTIPIAAAVTTGVGLGVAGTFAYDSFTRARNDFYNGMNSATDQATGKPLDESTKQYMSNGVGAVTASLESIGDFLTLGTVPKLAKFISPRNVNALMARTETKAAITGIGKVFQKIAETKAGKMAASPLAQGVARVGQSMATNATEEWLQEVTSILGEEMAANVKNGDVGIQNGIASAWYKIENDPRTKERLFGSAVVGGIAGGTFTAGGNLIGAAMDGIKRDASPTPLVDVAPENSNLIEPTNPNKASADILHAQNAINVATEVTKKTKLYKIDPNLATTTTANLIERTTGITEMYIGKEQFDALPEEQKQDIEAALDDQQKENLANNAPARLKTHQFAPLVDKHPSMTEWISLQPAGPWANSARDYANQVQKRAEAKQKIFGELGVMREQPIEERAANAAFTPETDDATIINTLKSKEGADAYLARLDMNEQAETTKPLPTQKTEKTFEAKDGKTYRIVLEPYAKVESGPAAVPNVANVEVFDEENRRVGSLRAHDEVKGENLDPGQRTYSPEKGKFVIDGVEVQQRIDSQTGEDTGWQRKGIASAMYDFLAESGYNIVADPEMQTESGKAFSQSQSYKSPQVRKIQEMRERVAMIREQLPDDQGAQAILQQALDTPDPLPDVVGEADLMTREVIPDEVKEVFGDNFIAEIENQEAENRGRLVEGVKEGAELEMNQVIDITKREANEAVAKQAEEDALANPNVGVVERFLNWDGAAPEGVTKSKGYPILAIDPKSLDADLQEYYNNDVETLKKRRVFKKGGMKLDDVARLLGRTPMELLDILARTQSKDEIVADAVAREEGKNAREAALSVDLNETAIINSYNARTNIIRRYMNWMKDEKWSTFKKAIAKVALTVPRSEEVRAKAMKAIGETTVGDLNANVHKVAERKSRSLAMKAVLNYDLVTAFQNFGRQMLNNEMTRATQIATGKVNAVYRLAMKMEGASIQRTLKDAGPEFVKAYNEIVETFNLRKLSKAKAEEFTAFKKWTEKMVKEGHGNFEFAQPMEIKEQARDMTVNEITAVGDALKSILKRAQEARMIRIAEEANGPRPMAQLVNQILEHAVKQPGFDIKKGLAKAKDSLTTSQKFGIGAAETISLIENLEDVMRRFDGDVDGGLMFMNVVSRLYGRGEFDGQGWSGSARDMEALYKHYKKIVKQYSPEEFRQLKNTMIDVPEFAGNPLLGNGRVSKAELIMMMMNYGNEGNRQRLSNFTSVDKNGNAQGGAVTADLVYEVAQRNLTHKDMRYVQAVWDMYESYKDRTQKLNMETRGVEVQMVEAAPFAFTDASGETQIYRGGYYPLNYNGDFDVDKIRKNMKDDESFGGADRFYADEMTNDRHTKNRVGSDRPLILDMDTVGTGAAMIIHDLNYRIPLRDTIKIMGDSRVAEAFTGVVGPDDFRIVMDTIQDLGESLEFRRESINQSGKIFEKILNQPKSTIAISGLVGNVKSLAFQFLSTPLFQQRVSGNDPRGVATTLGVLADMTYNFKELYKLAIEINPMIDSFRAGIDGSKRDPIKVLNPKKDPTFLGPFAAIGGEVGDNFRWWTETAFSLFPLMDTMVKTVFAVSAYRSFMNGHVPGYKKSDIMKMSMSERMEKAKAFAASVNLTVGTNDSEIAKSAFEKAAPIKALFFKDARALSHFIMAQSRKAKNQAKKGEILAAGSTGVGMIITLAVMRIMKDEIQRKFFEMWGYEQEERTQYDSIGNFALYTVGATPLALVESVPVGREIAYGVQTASRGKVVVQDVESRAMSDIGQAVYTGMHFMDYYEGAAELRPSDVRSLINTVSLTTPLKLPASFIVRDLPAYLEKLQSIDIGNQEAQADEYHNQLEKVKEISATMPPEQQVPEDVMQQLQQIDWSINPPEPEEASSRTPQGTFETIREIESGGDDFVENKQSHAYGRYQFMEETWKNLMKKYPDAGLTENGRMTSPEQQEIAMKLNTDESIAAMLKNNIEPTIENIYAFHFLGTGDALRIYRADDSTTLKDALGRNGQAVLDQNNFPDSFRVRNFKKWVAKVISKGEKRLAQKNKGSDEPKTVGDINWFASN